MFNLEDLQSQAPAVFRTKEAGAEIGASRHYQFMTTSQVITDLQKLGWGVHEARQQKSKVNPETTKHLIRFRSNTEGAVSVNGNIPEIILINSHDRTAALTFHVGVFRGISKTHLVIADKTFNQFKIRHMGTPFEAIKATIDDITAKLPQVFETIRKFEGISLNKETQIALAMNSLAIRFPEYLDTKTQLVRPDLINKAVNIEDLLVPQRKENEGDSLWNIFNTIQEHVVNGGFARMGETNKIKPVRPLNNIRLSMIVNKGIWSLADATAEYL